MPAQADSELGRFPEADLQATPGTFQREDSDPRVRPAAEASPPIDLSAPPQAAEAVASGAARNPSGLAEAEPAPQGELEEGQGEAEMPQQRAKEQEKQEPKPWTRAACMYRDTTLLWERVPGTCKP